MLPLPPSTVIPLSVIPLAVIPLSVIPANAGISCRKGTLTTARDSSVRWNDGVL